MKSFIYIFFLFPTLLLIGCGAGTSDKKVNSVEGEEQVQQEDENVTTEGQGENEGRADEVVFEEIKELFNIISVEAGESCKYGGHKIEHGLDINRNEILENIEVIRTSFFCYEELNDTGITRCGDYAYANPTPHAHHNHLVCSAVGASQYKSGVDGDGDEVPSGQDAMFGRDALAMKGLLQKVGAGDAGFDFTKLDFSGNDLPPTADEWHCVRDNVTGYIWETKQSSGLHNVDDTYTWYQTRNNNGNLGASNSGTCYENSGCDTTGFVNKVNAERLCGYSDWYLPSKEELQSIVHKGKFNPAVDTTFFPNTKTGRYWTSTPYSVSNEGAWVIYFSVGYEDQNSKSNRFYVRLVRNNK